MESENQGGNQLTQVYLENASVENGLCVCVMAVAEAATQQGLGFVHEDQGVTLLIFTHYMCFVLDDFFGNAMRKVV